MSAFTMIVRAGQRRLYWKLGQGAFQRTYSYVTLILPSMIMAPAYFRGEVELGAISQIFSAFNSVKAVLMFVANNFGVLADLHAKHKRIEDLRQSIARASTASQVTSSACNYGGLQDSTTSSSLPCSMCSGCSDNAQTIKLDVGTLAGDVPLLRVRGLCLKVQARSSQPGFRWLGTVGGKEDGSTFDVGPGASLLLKGASGVGKSALLRAVAGLWNEGVGLIERTRHVLFLPQAPYLPAGDHVASSTLREQLLFPIVDGSASHETLLSPQELCDVLRTVGLGALLDEHAGLDTRADWALSLSGGERQRLAFARLFVQLRQNANSGREDCLVLIDEATSACDEDTEAALYGNLLQSLRRGSLVSVGHRSSLSRFHTQTLELSEISS